MIGMLSDDIFIDEKFLKELLDAYAELTELSVVLYIGDGEKVFYSREHWPEFCQKIWGISELNKGCVTSYLESEEELYQCYAGLWCYTQPVKVDGKVVGTYIVGHRRISGKEEESKKVLEKTLSECKVNDEDSKKLMELMERVDVVTEDAFNKKLLDKFLFIEQIVIREHQRAIGFKKEAVSLAHEFLQPTQSIIADAENLFNEAEERSELKSIAEDILWAVTKLYFIAENIRRGMLEDHDEFEKEFRYVSIHPIIQDTIKLFRKEAKKKYVVIKDPVMNDIRFPVIKMSKTHIQQVFFNLTHNAVKYSYRGTEKLERFITVVCKSDGIYHCTEITNYGVGIKPEEISNGLIFKDGYRGILSSDRYRTGSGLGLSTSNRIIVAHGGYIEVKSKLMGSDPISDPYKTSVAIYIPFHQPIGKDPNGSKKDIMDRG